jgi:glucose/arabinose dehydrogenase
MGDGVNQFQVSEQPQNLDSLNGKILRMDRTGAGLPDNPFFDPNAPRSVRSRVWAFGLREPFRFAIHPRTGIPYVGNVGFHYHESIARATPGANFGWPCIDGVIPHRRARFTPICNTLDYATIEPSDVNYPHLRTQAAVIGGDFNFGDALPADTRGDFFFGDYIRGWVRRAELGSDGRIVRVLPVLTNVGNLVDMQFRPDGNLYVLSYGGGSLSRITASSAAAAAPSPDPAP